MDRSADHDEDRIEALLAEYLGRLELSGPEQAEAVLRSEPELSEPVRARAASLKAMGLLGNRAPERLGRYRIREVLGQGTMGVVYRAHDEHLDREVALKAVRPENLFFPEARARFVREVEILARLRHRHLVPILEVGEEQGLPYYAMELVEGVSLAQALARGGTDLDACVGSSGRFTGPWAQVSVRIVAEVAEALGHAHAHGVVHRDVKPANILLGRDGRALLVDFGLGRADGAHSRSLTRGAVGSLDYLAPELLRPDAPPQGPRQDVFALGMTLCRILTAAGPGRRLSGDVETVCQVAMDADPARRYADGAAMAVDLRAVLELRPPRARRPGRVLRVRRWVARHPARAVGLLLGSLALILAGLWLATRLDALRLRSRHAVLLQFQEALFAESEFARQGPSLNLAAAVQVVLPRFLPQLEQDPGSLATALLWAGRCLLGQGQPGAAGEYFARAAGVVGLEPELEVEAQCALAQSLCTAHRFAGAHEAIARAEARARRELGAQSPVLAAVLLAKGRVHADDYQWGQAIPCFEEALAVLGDRPELLELRVQIRMGLASAYRWSHRRCRDSDAFLQATIELATAARGPDSALVQQALREQASVRLVRGEWEEAVALGRRALVLARSIYGQEDHPQVVMAHNDLGLILRDTKHPAEAEPHLRVCLAAHRRLAAFESHVLVDKRINLAMVLRDLGRFAEAETLLREALAAVRVEMPPAGANPNHLDYECQNQLARLFIAAGQSDRAEPLLAEAVGRWRGWKDGHWALAWHLGLLADTLRARGRLADAEALYRESISNNLLQIYADVQYRRLNRGESIFEQNLESLRMLLAARGDGAGIRALDEMVVGRLREHLARRAKSRDFDPIATGSIHRLLGTSLVRLGAFAEARAELARAMAILEHEASPRHAEAVAAREWLAKCGGGR
jgi:tetratricopeptide (TPR) repeat protein/tRNA A-37 threonylcarbamoyl transferase component Bud32